jgi:hypothetical protein
VAAWTTDGTGEKGMLLPANATSIAMPAISQSVRFISISFFYSQNRRQFYSMATGGKQIGCCRRIWITVC